MSTSGRPSYLKSLALLWVCVQSAGSLSASTFFPTASELAIARGHGGGTAAAGLKDELSLLPHRIEEGREFVEVDDMRFAVSSTAPNSAAEGNLWTGGNVFYIFDAGVTETNRQAWRDAAAQWSASAAVTFSEGTGSGNYINVQSSTVNNSYMGMIGGPQTMNISNWTYKFIIAHEIGHALGLMHEQSRPDRDSFVYIYWSNIQSGAENNFYLEAGTVYGAYDFDSVMHYRKNAFSTNGLDTIEPVPAYSVYLDSIGQRTHLSSLDQTGMAQRYGPVSGVPTVQTVDASSITSTTSVLNGTVVNNNGSPPDSWFFDYDTVAPTSGIMPGHILNASIAVAGNNFSASLPSPSPATTYYFRAWAHNASTTDAGNGAGWGKGTVISFTTPSLVTYASLSLTANPVGGGSVTGAGSYPVSSTQSISASANSGWTFTGWNDGNTSTTRNVTVPADGITYTANFSAVSTISPPTVKTADASSVAGTSAILNGTISADGGAAIDRYFFYYWDDINPSVAIDNASVTVVGSSFSAQASGLTPGTNYHFKAYAHNSSLTDSGAGVGWGFGSVLDFRTLTAAVANPAISPNGGTFRRRVTVTLSCATAGAVIHYTTDGSDPTSTSAIYAPSSGRRGSRGISVTGRGIHTVKALGSKSGSPDSGVAAASFTIN